MHLLTYLPTYLLLSKTATSVLAIQHCTQRQTRWHSTFAAFLLQLLPFFAVQFLASHQCSWRRRLPPVRMLLTHHRRQRAVSSSFIYLWQRNMHTVTWSPREPYNTAQSCKLQLSMVIWRILYRPNARVFVMCAIVSVYGWSTMLPWAGAGM